LKAEDLTAQHPRSVDDIECTIARDASVDDRVVEAKPAKVLHRSYADRNGAWMSVDIHPWFNNQAAHAAPSEISGKRETDRTCACD
jgi:hypothetical protein